MVKSRRLKKILIVDDNEDFLEIFEYSLRQCGDFNILKISDSFAAYEITREENFDLIFVDYNMPKLTGAQLIKKKKKTSFNEMTPVVLVTAFPETVHFEEKVDGVFFLTKPVSGMELVNAINHATYHETV